MMGFTVQRWAAWAPGLVDRAAWETWLREATLPPSRRHARAVRDARDDAPPGGPAGPHRPAGGLQAHAEAPDAPVLFASRYGDLGRSVELLTQLARSEPVSPTSFSLSVHNAIGALYSIARGDTSSYSAIAAGEETVEAAFTEACGLLSDGVPRVLVVIYDEPVPAPWEHFSESVAFPHAWACLLGADTGEGAIRLGCHAGPPDAAPAEADGVPVDLRALRFLVSGARQWEHPVGARRWRWERHA